MLFDIFFSISRTPDPHGRTPSESEMFSNFFRQVEAADRQGFGTAWVAESHLSSEVQKRNSQPVIPHWKGEVGLNGDICQLAHQVYKKTKHIEVGSAVMNIHTNGGPIAAAEKIATFCTLHGLDPQERRKIHIGFSAGRFEYMNRPFGVLPRNEIERAAWPALKGRVFEEACEIFLRLLKGETLHSEQIAPTLLRREHFRSDSDWEKVQKAHGGAPDQIEIERRWKFEDLKIIPEDWRRDLLQLVIGSHDPPLQEKVNQWLPVQVFNLSITQPEIIEQTHQRMSQAYHASGGSWQRSFMPRTVFVFLHPDSQKAHAQAQAALGAYWTALEGTIDPQKIQKAANNALVGNPEEIAQEILQRFHPDDRLMLWFDFFNHDCDQVISSQEIFMNEVAPLIERNTR